MYHWFDWNCDIINVVEMIVTHFIEIYIELTFLCPFEIYLKICIVVFLRLRNIYKNVIEINCTIYHICLVFVVKHNTYELFGGDKRPLCGNNLEIFWYFLIFHLKKVIFDCYSRKLVSVSVFSIYVLCWIND
jgi:hypothetical protein